MVKYFHKNVCGSVPAGQEKDMDVNMNGKKAKKFEKLQKKRMWPSIVLFIGFVVSCIAIIVLFVQLFATYIFVTKITHLVEETRYISDLMDSVMEQKPVPEAVEYLQMFLTDDNNVYVVDSLGREVVQTGNSHPDFDVVMDFALGEEMVVIADSESDLLASEGPDTVFAVPIEEIFAATFAHGPANGMTGAWVNETIIQKQFWLQAPLGSPEYRMYVKCSVEIQRQDILFVCLFGIAAFILLLIPSTFLFVNAIRSIVNQRRVTQLLYLDTVTGGKNWFYFQNRAARILCRRKNNKKTYAMVNLHLERYQNYCACYGVKDGEDLLGGMDGFLEARTDREETFARHEGADFGLLLHCAGENAVQMQESCQKRVRSLLAELTGLKPDHKIHFHAGIYMIYPEMTEKGRCRRVRQDADIDQMYNYANAARLSSNCKEEQRIRLFGQDILSNQIWERTVEDTMETALHNEEFRVYLQPKYSPADGKMVGAEALVRWISPEKGIIPPGRFIPIFEQNGFITQLDDYMISHVAKLQAEWTIRGKKQVPVSVNVSRAHFAQEGLAEHICRLVDAYGPKHELIELEVTESAFFDDKDILVETVKQLKAYGFHVSMDDFGAGYSSLNSLKDIPLDVLKLDGEFFRGEDDDGRGEIVVQEAIQLARNLNMRVVAEGVEKKEQVDFLARQGCDMIQGYYFAKPMPVAEFEEKMEKDA